MCARVHSQHSTGCKAAETETSLLLGPLTASSGARARTHTHARGFCSITYSGINFDLAMFSRLVFLHAAAPSLSTPPPPPTALSKYPAPPPPSHFSIHTTISIRQNLKITPPAPSLPPSNHHSSAPAGAVRAGEVAGAEGHGRTGGAGGRRAVDFARLKRNRGVQLQPTSLRMLRLLRSPRVRAQLPSKIPSLEGEWR